MTTRAVVVATLQRGAVTRKARNPSRGVSMSIHSLLPFGLAVALLPLRAPCDWPSGSLSVPPTIIEYVIPRPGNFPHDPAVAADGTVWYTDQRNSFIGHLDP